jgi:hypothetical protein
LEVLEIVVMEDTEDMKDSKTSVTEKDFSTNQLCPLAPDL